MKLRRLAGGRLAYYWVPHERDREAGFSLGPEALGSDLRSAISRARLLNEHLDNWREGRDISPDLMAVTRSGTVDWWHEMFFRSEAFTQLMPRTQADYRNALAAIADLPTQITDALSGQAVRMGALPVSSLSPAAVDKIYARLRRGGEVTRQANYAIDVARRAWKIVRRQQPGLFLVPVVGPDGRTSSLAINPFEQVVRAKYVRDSAVPATRDEVLMFAGAAARAGHPALGVAAIICFEWLQRPEDVREGRLTWTDYRPPTHPAEVLVFHHKTGKRVWQPLETEDGLRLYPELESMIECLPRVGVPMVALAAKRGSPRLYSESYSHHLVQRIRRAEGLPEHFTLEACRHGGMTELGDAGLTEQEVMALSGHATPAAARLYVKRTAEQRLAAATQRRSYVEASKRTKRG